MPEKAGSRGRTDMLSVLDDFCSLMNASTAQRPRNGQHMVRVTGHRPSRLPQPRIREFRLRPSWWGGGRSGGTSSHLRLGSRSVCRAAAATSPELSATCPQQAAGIIPAGWGHYTEGWHRWRRTEPSASNPASRRATHPADPWSAARGSREEPTNADASIPLRRWFSRA